jgi:hypothetical protein
MRSQNDLNPRDLRIYRRVILRRTFSYLGAGLVISAIVGGLYRDRMHFIWALCAIGAIFLAYGWLEYLKMTDSLPFFHTKKAKNIKTMDDAYDFAKNDLGMKCTKKEFNEGAKYLEYIGDQIKKETAKAEDQAKNAYLDAVAVYMTAEKQLSEAQGEYAKYSKKLEAEIKANRKLAPKYIEKAAKEREKETKKFNEEVKKVLESKDAKQFLDYVKNFEDLGKKFSKAKNTKQPNAQERVRSLIFKNPFL